MNPPYRTPSEMPEPYSPTWWRRLLCWLGQHEYLWDGRIIIRARAIRSWSRLDSKLPCAHCPATIGPQPGRSVFEK